MLASQSARYEESDADSFQLLLRASVFGNVEQTRQLLENGANVNDCNEIGQTALLAASLANETETCRLLLENGAEIDHKDIGGYTALHLTTSIDTLKVLLEHIDDRRKRELINAKTKNGRTPLHEAALHGPTEKVIALLDNQAIPDSEDMTGATPLHYTLARSGDGDITILSALVEAGADVNKQNAFLQTPLAIACKQHQFMRNTIPILLKAGADPMIQSNDGNTALHVLFFGTNLFEPNLSVDIVEEIVESNMKCLDTANLFGELPIHGALTKRGNEDIILRLFQYNTDAAYKLDNLGRTVLHLACEKDYVDILKNFIANHFNSGLVIKPDHLGRTILHYSCMYSQDGQSVHAILHSNRFQKCDLIDCFGLTAYQYAMTRHDEIKNALTKILDDHFQKTHNDSCKIGTNHLKKYFDVFEEPKSLAVLLSNMAVKDKGVFPSCLRPIQSAEQYINEMWTACKSPVKNMVNFDGQRKMVENFMKKLIQLMGEHDVRFSGNLVMRGSAYEETIADERGDFDFMLNIEELAAISTVLHRSSDPPGFVRLQRIPDKDVGDFKEFFDNEGFLRSEKILSKFALSVMYALHQPVLWMSSGLDFFPKLKITWKERPALNITCRMFYLSTFVPVSIDFLPTVHCQGWWPDGNRCSSFLDEKSMQLGCQLIIKPPNVPYYQHAKFGIPHHYLRMSFSEAETSLSQRCHANVKKAFIISKLLLDRKIDIPWNLLSSNSEDRCKFKMSMQTKNCVSSFLLKQSLFNVLNDHSHKKDDSEDNLLIWVQRIFSRFHRSLKEGNLPSVFLPSINHLHTFQPDDSLENIRNVIVQIIYHSLLEEEIPLNIDYDVSWHRSTTEFERGIHKRLRYLNQILQSPEERE